jgi:hypothetical protein
VPCKWWTWNSISPTFLIIVVILRNSFVFFFFNSKFIQFPFFFFHRNNLLYEIVYPIIGINWHMSLFEGFFMWKNIKLKFILANYFFWPTRREEWIKYEYIFVFLNYWIFVLLYYCDFHVHLPPNTSLCFNWSHGKLFFVAHQRREKWIKYECMFVFLNY